MFVVALVAEQEKKEGAMMATTCRQSLSVRVDELAHFRTGCGQHGHRRREHGRGWRPHPSQARTTACSRTGCGAVILWKNDPGEGAGEGKERVNEIEVSFSFRCYSLLQI